MKNTVLKYGTISGLLAAGLMLTSILIGKKSGYAVNTDIFGYIGIPLAFIPLYLGIRSYRQTEGGGFITFWKALNLGIIIVVISAVFSAVSWLMTYYWVTPDFPDKYAAHLIEQIKTSGKNLKDTVAIIQQRTQYKTMAQNPFTFGAVTFTEPLPLGIILTLICAAILKKNPPAISDAMVVEENEQNPA